MRNLKQSATANVMVFMTDAADHVSGKASLTLTITASKDGTAFASITPTVTERGNGWYALALTTSHTDTLGDLALHITGAGADPTDLLCRIVAGSLDADVSSRLASASYTAPDNASAIAAAIATRVAEGSLTWEHILRVLLAHAAGDATGLTTSPVFKSQDGLTDRIVGTISGGTRTVTSVDGS